jgi:hypothetical protein
MIVLDTSALSRAMGRDPVALAHAALHPPGELLHVLDWSRMPRPGKRPSDQ